MKNQAMKKILMAASCLFVTGQTGVVSAHEWSGTIGARKSAIDVYQVTCTTDSGVATEHLTMEVKDRGPKKAPKVSVQVFKGGLGANTTDPVDADDAYSPEVEVNGGNGVYYVLVDKTGGPAENYSLEYHCEGPGGFHTGTSIIQLVEQ